MNPPVALPLLVQVTVGSGLIALAVLVARTGWQHGHNRTFAVLYLLSGTKSISEGLLSAYARGANGALVQTWADHFHANSPLFPDSGSWAGVLVVCSSFMVPLLLAFVLEFPRPWPRFTADWRLRLALFVPALLTITVYFAKPSWLREYFVGFEMVATAVTLAALYRLFDARENAADPIARKQATYLLAGFFPAFAATWVLTFNDVTTHFGHPVIGLDVFANDWLGPLISPPLELVAAGAVAYAILKYRLLAFELRVKGGAKYVIMSFVVGILLFGLSTYIGNFVLQGAVFSFAGPTGSAVLSGIFTILLFKPVEKLSGRVADRLFPETRKVGYPEQRAEEIYQAQATLVLRDSEVTARELDFLHRLREQLGLDPKRAIAIEEALERRLGVDTVLGESAAK